MPDSKAQSSHGHVVRSTAVVGMCTGTSRLLGFVREILMAAFFGTSLAQSAFVMAFRIPNLFRRLFGEGALSSAFIPVFTETLQKEGRDEAWTLAGRVMGMLGVLLTAVSAVAILGITVVLNRVPVGHDVALVLDLLRIMFPYMVLICLVALCMAVLNSFHHFLLPASTPVLLNVIWILTLVLVCPRLGDTRVERIYGVAWGILIAGMVQLLAQVPMLIRYGFRGRLPGGWRADPRVSRVLLLMGPAAIGMGITQINAFVDTVLAFWIGPWAPAALSFSERLLYLPLGVFATALATVLLPVFSGQAAREESDGMRTTINRSLRSLMFIMIPAATGLLVLARPIVELVFERGEFDAWSTTLTARALAFYAPGLVVFSLYKVFVPAFYAMKDTRTPVRVGIRVVALNFVLNIAFLLTLPTHYKHAGFALATVLAGCVNAGTLGWLLHKRIGSPGWLQILRDALRVLCASVLMAVVVWWCHAAVALELADSGLPDVVSRLAAVSAAIGAGILTYVALALLLCRSALRELLAGMRSREGGADR
ncbi:MAG: murein biosynthesis integral membrane protein MurJ [Lentisphaerae bacterium]|nr:murein biosynthesis integral membrane protein MurJ [Lentisphaerota bacterium]